MKILTFDIEEWFHILDNSSTNDVKQWTNYESRIKSNMDIIFSILDKTGSYASFFVVGWIADRYPEIVKEISNRGYEIGSHSHFHQLVYQQNRKSFKKDLDRSIKTIEDLIGKKVESFRAPGFSITENNKWAFEILYDSGIKFDSSVFPAGRSHGGFKTYGTCKPSLLSYNGVTIKEFPINSVSFLNNPFIFSGGGYFRFFPYYFINKWTSSSDYIMTYFHPRDFDPEQPMISDLSLIRKFKSYYGLKHTRSKLESWLNDYKFIDLREANSKIDWSNVELIKI